MFDQELKNRVRRLVHEHLGQPLPRPLAPINWDKFEDLLHKTPDAGLRVLREHYTAELGYRERTARLDVPEAVALIEESRRKLAAVQTELANRTSEEKLAEYKPSSHSNSLPF